MPLLAAGAFFIAIMTPLSLPSGHLRQCPGFASVRSVVEWPPGFFPVLPTSEPQQRLIRLCQRSLKSSPKRSPKSSPSEKDWMGDFFGAMGTDPIPAWAGFIGTQDCQRGWLREEDCRAGARFGFASEIPAASD